jgi:hypothetical protein
MPQLLPLAPALITGGSSIVSGLLGKSASQKAAEQQQLAQQKAIQQAKGSLAEEQGTLATANGQANDILSRGVDTTLGMYDPYVRSGQGSLTSLIDLAGDNGPLAQKFSFGQADLDNDPGYQFALQQGQQAIQKAAAARGGLFSSGTLKSLAGYTTGTANQYFNDAFSRAQSTFNTNRQSALSRIGTLQGLAGMGLNATGAGADAVGRASALQSQNTIGTGELNARLADSTSARIGNLLVGQGTSQAAGTVGGTNAVTGAIGNATKAISDFLVNRNRTNTGVSKPSTSYTSPGDWGGGGYSPGDYDTQEQYGFGG